MTTSSHLQDLANFDKLMKLALSKNETKHHYYSKEHLQLQRFSRATQLHQRGYRRHQISHDIWGRSSVGLKPQAVTVRALNPTKLPHGCRSALDLLRDIDCDPQFTPSAIPTSDIDVAPLLAASIVELADPASVRGMCINHYVPEKLGTPKARLRLVTDCLSANLACPHSKRHRLKFTPIRDVLSSIARLQQAGPVWFLTIDLTCSFFQVPLHAMCRDLFVFRARDEKLYRFCRLPMGYTLAVDIMHGIMSALAAEASCSDVFYDCYVDNALWVSSDRSLLERISKKFVLLAQFAGVTIGEHSLSLDTTYRGVHMTPGNFSLKPSFVQKCMDRIEFSVSHSTLRLQHLEGTIGCCSYADEVLQPTPFRDFFAAYGQLCASRSSTNKMRLSPASISEFQRVRLWVASSVPWSRLLQEPGHTMIFSDASKNAFGHIRIDRQDDVLRTNTTAWRHDMASTRLNISPIELHSVVFALNEYFAQAKQFLEAPLPVVFSDNIPAVRAVQRRYSSSIAMMRELRQLIAPRGCPTIFIPGELNCADKPSRLKHSPAVLDLSPIIQHYSLG